MKMHGRIGFILLVLACSVTFAQRASFTEQAPPGAEEILSRMADEAFFEIRQKYNDLQQNFSPHFKKSGLSLNCRTSAGAPNDGRSFSSVYVDNQIRPGTGRDTGAILTLTSISHFDCFENLLFVERVVVTAPAAVPVSVDQAVKFRRFFHVQAGEFAREYTAEGADGKLFFSVQSRRTEHARVIGVTNNFALAGLEWMRLEQTENAKQERSFLVQMYSGKFPVATGEFTIDFGLPTVSVHQLWSPDRLIHEVENEAVSQVQFDGHMQSLVVGLTAQFLQIALRTYIDKLPLTTKTLSGVADSPFLRELQLNYNRLVSKKEEAQVRKFFEKTIQDIKEGRLRVE